jgi:galactose mutarotase-like enzyme
MRQDHGDSFLLKAGDDVARFFARGAECRQWRVGDRDMLWPGDPAVWPAVAPVLFPTCGWSRDGAIRIGAATYPMPVHGFAAQSVFGAEQTGDDAIRFTLTDNTQTRAAYPFAFELSVTYRLAPGALAVEIAVVNRGATPMPYACGLHPGFVWGEGAHRFVFAEAERAEVPLIAPGGLFSERRRPVPLQGRVLPLDKGLFAAEALCFIDARSRSFSLEGPHGALQIEAPDFPHLVLWNTKAAPFLAIESWTGTGDPEGFTGDFHERPSMIHLPPGESRAHRVSYRWLPHNP